MAEISLARSAQEESLEKLVECPRHESEDCPRCDGSGFTAGCTVIDPPLPSGMLLSKKTSCPSASVPVVLGCSTALQTAVYC